MSRQPDQQASPTITTPAAGYSPIAINDATGRAYAIGNNLYNSLDLEAIPSISFVGLKDTSGVRDEVPQGKVRIYIPVLTASMESGRFAEGYAQVGEASIHQEASFDSANPEDQQKLQAYCRRFDPSATLKLNANKQLQVRYHGALTKDVVATIDISYAAAMKMFFLPTSSGGLDSARSGDADTLFLNVWRVKGALGSRSTSGEIYNQLFIALRNAASNVSPQRNAAAAADSTVSAGAGGGASGASRARLMGAPRDSEQSDAAAAVAYADSDSDDDAGHNGMNYYSR